MPRDVVAGRCDAAWIVRAARHSSEDMREDVPVAAVVLHAHATRPREIESQAQPRARHSPAT